MAFKKGNIPWNKGGNHSSTTILKIKLAKYNISNETRKKMSEGQKKRIPKEYKGKIDKICCQCRGSFRVFLFLKNSAKYCSRQCRATAVGKSKIGELHPRWIRDRNNLKRHNRRNDSAYVDWRKNVWTRDKFKCRISNISCSGRMEAHHILSWKDYPELRYDINNGITLCHSHHPRKRAEEIRLSPYFQQVIKSQGN